MNMTELLPRVLIWTRLINRHNGERSVFEDLLCQRYPSINVACIDKETKLGEIFSVSLCLVIVRILTYGDI